jgi:hypothetical protein
MPALNELKILVDCERY